MRPGRCLGYPDLGMLRAARLVPVTDGGRVLNEKTARSQITGGAVMAIGSGPPPAKHGMSPGRPARRRRSDGPIQGFPLTR